MSKKIDRTGEERHNNFGSKMIIKEYRNNMDIDVYFPEYNYTKYNVKYKPFQTGQIRCPYEKRAYGKGYLGEGKYPTKINKKRTKPYLKRTQMLLRCYDENYKKKQKTYENCKVCDKWLNFQNFAEWYEENHYEIKGQNMQLDKDILIKGNKIYSPKTCVFVPQEINLLFIKRETCRGNLPIGVHCDKTKKKVFVSSIGINNNTISLGRYKTPEEAFMAYKEYKEKTIKELANKYKTQIPQKLYDAMYQYEVEITD